MNLGPTAAPRHPMRTPRFDDRNDPSSQTLQVVARTQRDNSYDPHFSPSTAPRWGCSLGGHVDSVPGATAAGGGQPEG